MPTQQVGQQQGYVPLGALAGHGQIAEIAIGVDHRDTLGAQLRYQPGGLLDALDDGVALVAQVGPLVLVEVGEVEHRVVQQAFGEALTDVAVARLRGVGDEAGADGGDACVQGAWGRLRVDRQPGHQGGAAVGHQQGGQDAAVDVVEDVALLVADVGVFVAGHPGEDAEPQQQPHHRYQVAAVLLGAQGKDQAAGDQHRVGSLVHRGLPQAPEGGLELATLQGGQRQAQQGVAAAGERQVGGAAAGARGAAAVVPLWRALGQAREVRFEVQAPARLAAHPVPQPVDMALDQAIGRVIGVQQRLHQQGTHGPSALVQADLVEALAELRTDDRVDGAHGATPGAAGCLLATVILGVAV